MMMWTDTSLIHRKQDVGLIGAATDNKSKARVLQHLTKHPLQFCLVIGVPVWKKLVNLCRKQIDCYLTFFKLGNNIQFF